MAKYLYLEGDDNGHLEQFLFKEMNTGMYVLDGWDDVKSARKSSFSMFMSPMVGQLQCKLLSAEKTLLYSFIMYLHQINWKSKPWEDDIFWPFLSHPEIEFHFRLSSSYNTDSGFYEDSSWDHHVTVYRIVFK